MTIARALQALTDFGDREREWLQEGLRKWLRDKGNVPLTACLRLPGTPAKLREALRNNHLIDALWACDGLTVEEKRARLEVELRSMESFKAAAWLKHGPPDDASRVELILLEAFKAGDMPGERQRRNIIKRELVRGNVWCQTFPESRPTTETDETNGGPLS